MSALSADQLVTITEAIAAIIGVAAVWAIYYGSRAAELPGEAALPDPAIADDMQLDTRGRTL